MGKRKLAQVGALGALAVILVVVGFVQFRQGKFFGQAEILGVQAENLFLINDFNEVSCGDDITSGHWAYEYICAVVQKKSSENDDETVMNLYPDGEFHGNMPLNMKSFAANILRAFNVPKRYDMCPQITNIPAGDWAAPYIAGLCWQGYLEGFTGNNQYGGATGSPNDNALVSYMKKILANAGESSDFPPSGEESTGNPTPPIEYTAATTTPTLTPDSDVQKEWSRSTGTQNYALIDEPGDSTCNDDNIYNSQQNVTKTDIYGVQNVSLGEGAVISSIAVHAWGKSSSGSYWPVTRTDLKIGGSWQGSKAAQYRSVCVEKVVTFNGSWTEAEFNAMQLKLYQNHSGGVYTFRIHQLHVIATYTIPIAPTVTLQAAAATGVEEPTDSSVLTREYMAAYLAYNLNFSVEPMDESDICHPCTYLQFDCPQSE